MLPQKSALPHTTHSTRTSRNVRKVRTGEVVKAAIPCYARREHREGLAIANRLAASGADSLILGCTEVGMLLDQGNVAMPVFDTTLIHCKAVLDYALQ